jgi:asparagine synthase (glutamine-hydrolysing)
MCGIVGAFGKNWKYAYQALNLLEHRGPDGRAITYFPNGYFAHARLAIVDVAGGQQPLQNMAQSGWLICNGEIYNHPELRATYPDYPYVTHSDSEDILAVYTRHASDIPHHLEGMYAFAIMDEAGLFLARDPLGIKPLYYGEDNETFYFASEIKALQDIVPQVNAFPPGHTYSSQHGFMPYYDIQHIVQAIRDAGQTETTPALVREQLRRSVHTHLMADVPVGVFLSGGLDSSIIAALVTQELPQVHSFTVGMANSADRLNAREVAAHLGTIHHEYIYTTPEMIEALPEVIYYLESFDPALVRSAIANYFLARLASQHVKVILSGEGADELYSGYSYLKQFQTPQALEQELVEITSELHNRNLQRLDRMTMAHGLEGRVPFLDRQFVEFSFTVPVEQKLYGTQSIEKWVLRKAFEDMLPEQVVWRAKEKFAEGAGSAHVFQQIAEAEITQTQFALETTQIQEATGHWIRTKEELYYYRVFRRFFQASTIPMVGFSRSL